MAAAAALFPALPQTITAIIAAGSNANKLFVFPLLA